jgi:hypothetical protein
MPLHQCSRRFYYGIFLGELLMLYYGHISTGFTSKSVASIFPRQAIILSCCAFNSALLASLFSELRRITQDIVGAFQGVMHRSYVR